MCKIKTIEINGRTISAADIKTKYLRIIAEAAKECDYIDKVVLFGSSLRESCREDSDIDIAVFGNQTRGKAMTSAKYRRFLNSIYSFDNFDQTYDILYFKTGIKYKAAIMDDIQNGEIIYAR